MVYSWSALRHHTRPLMAAAKPTIAVAQEEILHKPERIPALDGLRGCAFLLVFVYHFSLMALGDIPHPPLLIRLFSQAASLGWMGVDLFFVLSGFLITGILWDSRKSPTYYRRFITRRARRIFPAYYLWLVVVSLAAWHFRTTELGNVPLLVCLTYTFNWFVGFTGWGAVSQLCHHFWSLCIEEQFYLVWPWCVRRGNVVALSVLAIMLSPLLRFACLQLPWHNAAVTFTPCRLDGLAWGALLALAFRQPRVWERVKRLAPWVAGFALAALLTIVKATHSTGSVAMGVIGISIGALGCAAMLGLSLSRLTPLFLPVSLRWCGNRSYGLYLIHQPVLALFGYYGLTVAQSPLPPSLAFFALLLLSAWISTILAVMSWRWVEQPFMYLDDLSSWLYPTLEIATRGVKALWTRLNRFLATCPPY